MRRRALLAAALGLALPAAAGQRYERGSAFIALGALHLYGARGVLALLEQDGYAAQRLY